MCVPLKYMGGNEAIVKTLTAGPGPLPGSATEIRVLSWRHLLGSFLLLSLESLSSSSSCFHSLERRWLLRAAAVLDDVLGVALRAVVHDELAVLDLPHVSKKRVV